MIRRDRVEGERGAPDESADKENPSPDADSEGHRLNKCRRRTRFFLFSFLFFVEFFVSTAAMY